MKSRFSRAEWCWFGVLLILLALGLWQGYGVWLLVTGGGHAG